MTRVLLIHFWFMLAQFGLAVPNSNAGTPAPILDLRQSSLNLSSGHELMLDWEFYWEQFLLADDFNQGHGKLSGVLSQRELNKNERIFYQNQGLSKGFLTMRAHLLLPARPQSYTVFVPRQGVAYKIWLDGRLVASVGKLGTDAESSESYLESTSFELQAKAGANEIIVQLSNFSAFSSGIHRPLKLFSPPSFMSQQRMIMLLDFFLCGAVLVMSFYHFALYLIRRSEPAALFFGVFCLIIGVRSLIVSDGLNLVLNEAFGALTFNLANRIELLGFTLGVISFNLFMKSLYPLDMPKIIPIGVMAFSIPLTLLILFSENFVYQRFIYGYQIVAMLVGFSSLLTLYRAVRAKRAGARIFVFGFVWLFGAMINDILNSNRIIHSFEMISFGLFFFILAQSIILSKRFAQAFEQIKLDEIAIRKMNDELEFKVNERTQTIRTILDNVQSGFFLLNRQNQVMEGFTKSCLGILGSKITVGASISNLLNLAPREKMQLDLALLQVFDDTMPEDVSLAQIPQYFKLSSKVVMLHGSVIRDQGAKPQALLLSISDATQLVRAEEETRKNRSLLKIISEKSAFRVFISDSIESLQGCMTLLEQRNQQEIAMVLHTLKGNFALYGLDTIAAFIHEIEEKSELSVLDIRTIIQIVEEFISLNGVVLGIKPHGHSHEVYEVSGEGLKRLEVDLQKSGIGRQSFLVVSNWLRNIRMVAVRELLGPIEANVERVAKVLGKQIKFEIVGAELRIDPDRMRLPLKNIVHALINSIDHGIEFPEDRGPKPLVGKIQLSFCFDDLAYFKIKIEDDGCGLDLDLIRHIALEKGLMTREEIAKMSDQEVQSLIFRQGFSTKSNVSEFSGRGVGIAALDFAVRSLGGQVQINSKTQLGTTIEISIPTEQTLDLLTATA